MGFIDTFFNIDVMLRVFPMLIAGLKNTALLAVCTLLIGSLCGIGLCILRLRVGNEGFLRWQRHWRRKKAAPNWRSNLRLGRRCL